MIVSLLITACNTTKYVPEGEYLLNDVSIETDTKTIPKEEIKSYVRQMPNSEVLGFFKMQLGLYNWAGRDTTKRVNRFLKRIGDEPVIYNQQLTDITENQISKLYYNRGFMNAKVSSDVNFPKEKMAEVTYKVTSNLPYKINGYSINIIHPELFEIASDTARSLIKPGNLFDRDGRASCRERV